MLLRMLKGVWICQLLHLGTFHPLASVQALAKAFPSQSVTHKGRSRTTSAQRVGVISLDKKRAVSQGSEREKSRSKEDNLQRRDGRLSNKSIALREQLEKAANANRVIHQQASVHVNRLSMTEQAVRDELTRVRGIAEKEQSRASAESAREREREREGKRDRERERERETYIEREREREDIEI